MFDRFTQLKSSFRLNSSENGKSVLDQPLVMVAGLCALSVLGRLWLEVPNFKPTMAVALISGTLFKDWRLAIAAPLLSMLLSDLWIGSYELPLMLAVYACMLAPVAWSRLAPKLFGSSVLGRWVTWNVGGVLAAGVFYIVTNFVCWAATPWYPQTWDGLVSCYVSAIPFLRWMVLGNLLFVNLLAGILAAATLTVSNRQVAASAR